MMKGDKKMMTYYEWLESRDDEIAEKAEQEQRDAEKVKEN